MLLGKADILKASDLQFEDVEVPEWGGKVRLRSLSGRDRETWENYVYHLTAKPPEERNLGDFRARLLVLALVDAKGNRLFNDDEVHLLAEKNAQVLQRLFERAQRLSGIGQAELEAAEKN